MSYPASAKRFAEFFAGIGLVRYGLESGGWRCAYANDMDAKKRAMYEGHFGTDEAFHLGDVWDTQRVLDRWNEPCFLATASFPCTDMSLAGRRRGFAGRESSAFFGFARAIEMAAFRPPLVLLENVVGFATARDGADFRAACEALGQLGYFLDAFVLDARWFTPQSRPRLFLVGVHESVSQAATAAVGSETSVSSPVLNRRPANALRSEGLLRAIESSELATGWVTLAASPPTPQADALAKMIDVGDDQAWWPEEQTQRHLDMMAPKHRTQVDVLVEQRATTVATVYRRIRQGEQRAEPRWDGIAGCLRTPRGGSARQIVLAIRRGEVNMKWMTPREYARLQGAGDFRFDCGVHQALFGFGDAVCAPAIAWIDREILSPIHAAVTNQPADVGG